MPLSTTDRTSRTKKQQKKAKKTYLNNSGNQIDRYRALYLAIATSMLFSRAYEYLSKSHVRS